jgi:hypothetical protein
MSLELYAKMIEFLPDTIQDERFVGYDKENDSCIYLHDIIEYRRGWVVNLDEDCYVFNWKAVEEIINYMDENDYAYAGMPDGGVCSTRERSWMTVNPFFNVFNVDKIRDKYVKRTREEIDTTPVPQWADMFKPVICTGKYDLGAVSPFSGLFNWLWFNFKVLNLDARNHPDRISTQLLDLNGKPFCAHSWYSREYNNDLRQKDRIDRLYEECRLRKTLNDVMCDI